MSIYAVNYLCREVLRDQAFRAAMPFVPPCLSCRHEGRSSEHRIGRIETLAQLHTAEILSRHIPIHHDMR
jgi:hypothetical protein